MGKVLTKQNFLDRAKETHGETYDYSKVKFRDSTTKVTIICKKHGEFKQDPSSHMRGNGCPYCSFNRPTKDEVISKLKELYGNKYDLSGFNYSHQKKVINKYTLKCNEHGIFSRSIIELLKGEGCPVCHRLKKNGFRTNKTVNTKQQYFFVKIKFIPANASGSNYVYASGFKTKIDAMKFVDDYKLFLEMTDSVLQKVEIIDIQNPKQKILEQNEANEFIKCFNISSEKEYLEWWDKLTPSYIPRNLAEYYPNYKSVFLNPNNYSSNAS